LKSRDTAKSLFSLVNDFNSLRGSWRNDFISQAKFSSSQAKHSLRKRNLPRLFGGYNDSKDIGVGLIGVGIRNR
jgi:hypothetical protein